MWPTVAIQLCTYKRYDEIRKVVDALIEYVDYPRDRIKLYVCDDSTPGNYITKLKRLKAFKYWDTTFLVTEKNGSWGANVNNGLRRIDEPYIFFCEDDYVLKQPLDLKLGVALLETRKNIGMLRYRGTAGAHMIYHQFETDVSDYLPDIVYGYGAVPAKIPYLQLDSGGHDLYIYSHGPHLKARSFHEVHGFYPEGLRLGETEEKFAHLVKDRMQRESGTTPAVAIFPEWIRMGFDHIGVSFQHSEEDT